MTLTLSLCSRVIDSAYYLTKRNIWVKFNDNNIKGSGDMERTRNSRVNPLTLTFDLNLESRWLNIALRSCDTKESTCLLRHITTEKSDLCQYAVCITRNTTLEK